MADDNLVPVTVYMEDLDVNDCSDETFLPDFDGSLNSSMMTTSGTKRKSDGMEEDGFDDRLKRAARLSESEGSMTPLVKEELRCFIAAKRHQQGKQEIKAEFKEPVNYPLTLEEIEKKERRREQNRRAATKCRKKKKDAKLEKENEMKTLRDENQSLSSQVRDLQNTVKHYSEVLRKHEMSGQCVLHQNQKVVPPTPSFLANIPTHIIEDSYCDTPGIESPSSPSSFFTSSADCVNSATTCSGYMQSFTGNTRISPEIGDVGSYLNPQNDLTPPVSPYITEIAENNSTVFDQDLSEILHSVDVLGQYHDY